MNAIVLFYPRVQLFTKGWPTHTKNIAAKRWRRLQQLPPFSAQSNSTIIAQRRTSPVLCKLCDSLKRLFFFFLPHSGYLRLVNREPERRAVVVLMARFASPPIIPENLLLHGYIVSLKNATVLSNKRAA